MKFSIFQRIFKGMKQTIVFIMVLLPINIFGSWYDCGPCRCKKDVDGKIAHCKSNKNDEYIFNQIPSNLDVDITEFFLNGQELKVLRENNFIQYYNLKEIDVSSNKIIFLEDNILNNLTSLLSLDMSQNQIIKLPTTIFLNAPNLVSIRLQHNSLTYLQTDLFSNLNNLKYINIERNSISNIERNCFTNLPSLNELNLSHNNLKTLSLNVLNTITRQSMRHLTLHGNPWTCNKQLCEIVEESMKKFWMRKSNLPVCDSPKIHRTVPWNEFFENIISLTATVSNDTVILQSETCTPNQFIWKVNGNEISNNATHADHSQSYTLFNATKFIEAEEKTYLTCHIRNCTLCKEMWIVMHYNHGKIEVVTDADTDLDIEVTTEMYSYNENVWRDTEAKMSSILIHSNIIRQLSSVFMLILTSLILFVFIQDSMNNQDVHVHDKKLKADFKQV